MIIDKRIRNLTVPRDYVKEHISKLKENNFDLKVIDVGGGICHWAPETTHIADIFIVPGSREVLEKNHPEMNIYQLDISDTAQWEPILKYVEENGKFDYSICTHTLEDISNPKIACEMLMKISKAGVIAVPSKYAEYMRFEKQYSVSGYRGFFHHKWIWSLKNNVLRGFEKNNYWEYVTSFRLNKVDGIFTEICFMWEESFETEFYHLGQVVGSDNCTPMYHEITKEDDLVIK